MSFGERKEIVTGAGKKHPIHLARSYTQVRLNPDVCIEDRTGTHFGPEDARARVALRQLLVSFSQDPHVMMTHKTTLIRHLGAIRETHLCQLIETLLMHLKPAELMLDKEARAIVLQAPALMKKTKSAGGSFRSWFSRDDTKKKIAQPLTFEHVVFEPFHQLITTLQTCVEQSTHEEMRETLQALIDYYQMYIKQLIKTLPEARKSILEGPAMLCTAEGDYYVLSEDIAQKILPLTEEGMSSRVNVAGSHSVSNYEGIHFKKDPDALAVELAIDYLNRLIFNAGSTPSTICKIYRQNCRHVLLASKTVSGKMVFDLLEQQPESLKDLDPNHFSAAIVSSVLTNPQDNKADNYMAHSESDAHGLTPPVAISNIDQDMGFTAEFYKIEKGDEHYVGVRNILYFFPQMHETIGEDIRKYLQTLSPALLLLDWLKTLMLKNQDYQALYQKGVLTLEEMDALQLPLCLKPGTIGEMYRKLHVLVELCQSERPLTNADLVATVSPHLWQVYQLCAPEKISIMDAYYKTLLHTSVETMVQQASPEEAMDLLEHISSYSQPSMDFMNRKQSLAEALQELMRVIDFSGLSVPHQKQVVERLLTFQSFTAIQLSHCEALNDDLLFQFAQNAPHLTRLMLDDCPHITEAGLAVLGLRLPNLTLCMTQNAHIGHYQWPDFADSFRGGFELMFSDGFSIVFPLDKSVINDQGLLIKAAQVGSREGVEFLLQNN